MQNYPGLRAYLAACLYGIGEQGGEAAPVGRVSDIAFLERGFCRAIGAPQHAIAYLVAWLDEIGGGTRINHLRECVLGIGINLLVQLSVAQLHPLGRCPLLGRVCPRVGIMEIEHQLESRILDALSQLLHILYVLAGVRVLVAAAILAGIYEQPKTHGIHTLFLEKLKRRGDGRARVVKICGLGFLVLRKKRYVTTNKFLCASRSCRKSKS